MNEPQTSRLKVAELDCAEEARAIRRALEKHPGVSNVEIDILRGEITVAHQPVACSCESIVSALREAGLTATPTGPRSSAAPQQPPAVRSRLLILTLAAATCLLAGFVADAIARGTWEAFVGEDTSLVAAVLYSISALLGLAAVVPKTWAAIRGRRADMNLLMTVAVLGALGLRAWMEAATVALLFLVSLLLEQWSLGRARRAIESLLELAPELARRKNANHAGEEVPVGEIAIDETIIVRPGERVPLDGNVLVGDSAVNEAPITGESLPVDKQPGDPVYAGAINGHGVLEVRVTRTADDSTLARMIQMVHAAQSRRAPQEQWIERFAARYTPAMIVLSLLIASVPPLLLGDWGTWLYRGLVVIVIACPCALVISTPVTLVSALACAARRGVLVKGGRPLEVVSRVVAVALDKTGTLTLGVPDVRRVVPLSGHSHNELLERAAALGAPSTHPLSQAVVRRAEADGVAVGAAEDYQALTGKGAEARLFGGREFWIGSHRLLHEKIDEPHEVHQLALELEQSGETVVSVGNKDHVCGLLGVADRVREESRAAIASFKELGVKRVALLTGDHAQAAQRVADETGVDEVFADLLPEDKVQKIHELQQTVGSTAMVGDGINDAPALAAADVGIAMGALGSDAAIETADIALLNDELARVPWLINHARRAMRIVRFNVGFALGIKALFLLLTALGAASLWLAIAADTGATLLVTANGLRMLRSKELG